MNVGGVFIVWTVISSLSDSHYTQVQAIDTVKTIYLNEYTPQGFLHLPSLTKFPDNYTCHYLVSYSGDLISKYGISVGAVSLQLAKGDYIELSSSSALNDNVTDVEQWNKNVSSSTSIPSIKKEFAKTESNICIKLVGKWETSKASILLTSYYNNTNGNNCPSQMLLCQCGSNSRNDDDNSSSSEEDTQLGNDRCLHEDLFCNGISNCGVVCNYDETEKASNSCRWQQTHYMKEACVWTDFEYLLMMVMTGFLLILIPVVFLLTMMYHRRATNAMNYGDCDGNNNVESCRDYPHTISTAPRPIDEPPRYDDLPDELKIPPRERQGTSSTSTSALNDS